MDFAERAARNETVFRDINERIEAGAEMLGITASELIHCECDRVECLEMVEMRPAAYREVLDRRYHFITALGHADPRIEQVVEEHDNYCVVEKIGEAREALDKQHPQQRHT